MKAIFATLLIGLSLAGSQSLANEVEARLPEANEALKSQRDLAIRSSSPDANFGTKGEKIGWIREGEIVKALSVKQVSTVFGFEVWMEVRTSNGVRGWVLAGATAEVLKGNGGLAKLETMESSNLIAKANF